MITGDLTEISHLHEYEASPRPRPGLLPRPRSNELGQFRRFTLELVPAMNGRIKNLDTKLGLASHELTAVYPHPFLSAAKRHCYNRAH